MFDDAAIKKYSTLFPLVIIVTSFFAIIFSLVILKRPDYAIKGIFFSSGCIFAMILLIWIHQKKIIINEIGATIKCSYKIFLIGYVLLFMILNISLLYYDLSIITKFFLFCIFILVLIQILMKAYNSAYLVLSELIFVQIFIFYSRYVAYPEYFGGTDLLIHESYVNYILKCGNIISNSIDSTYSNFPLFHVFHSMNILSLNLNFHITSYILGCLTLSLLLALLFKYFNKLINNKCIALLCVYSYVLLMQGFYLSSYMIPRFFPVVAMILIIYLFLKMSDDNKNKLKYTLLIFVISIFIILVHQVSAIFVSLIFLLYTASEIGFKKDRSNMSIFLFLFTIAWIFDWFYVSFFSLELVSIAEQKDVSFAIALSDPKLADSLFVMINNIHQVPLIFFTFLGMGFFLFYNGEKRYLNYIIIFFLLSFTLIKTPIQNMTDILAGFSFNRFALYCAPLVSGIVGCGLYSYFIITKIFEKNRIILLFFLGIFLFLFIGGYIQLIQFGSPEKEYFTNSELNSINFIEKKVPGNFLIFMDYYSSRAPDTIIFKNIQIFGDLNQIEQSQQYLFYIDYQQLSTSGLIGKSNIIINEEKNGGQILKIKNSDDLIYSNQNIEIFSNLCCVA